MKVLTKHPTGHVLLRDRMNRAAARAYNDALFARGVLGNDGEGSLNPADIDRASEALVLALTLKVVHYKGEGEAKTEEDVEPTQAWMDELDEADFKALSTAALKLKQQSRETAKK